MDTVKPPPTRDGGRNDGLDLIRATGALLVFATHLYHSFGQTWLGPLAAGGNVGIFLFFPLSGYLLYRPFLQGQVDLRRYARARVARLAPAYYVALGVSAALGIIPGIVANPLPTLTMTNNIWPEGIAGFGQSWTIGVEMTFYLLLPALALLRGGTLWLVALASFLGMTVGGEWFWHQLPALLWAFVAGMLVARYEGMVRSDWPWLLGAPLLVYGVVVVSPLWTTLGATVLILWAAKVRPSIPWARFPANISYGIYLWHIAPTILLARVLDGPALVVAAFGVVVAIASASWFLVERPILRSGTREARPKLRPIRPVDGQVQRSTT